MSDPVRHYSSVREVLAEVAEFPRELVHHLLEDHGVDVLACKWGEGTVNPAIELFPIPMQGGSKRQEKLSQNRGFE